MTTYGLTATGLVIPTLDVLIDDFVTRLRDTFGASQNFGANTIEGQVVGILANALAQLWELQQASVAAWDPDSAVGVLLESVCALTGTFRPAARASIATLTLTGTADSVIPASTQARTAATQPAFATTAEAVLLALDAWAISTAYVVDDRVANSSRAYACITAGTSAGAGGPATTSDDITDGTAHWRYLGEGEAAVDAAAACVEDGPTIALSGTITEIVTPVAGLQSVVNVLDATVGRDVATDEELRVLREVELAAAGNGTADAVRATLLEVPDVTAATVFYNDQDATDPDGVPPHAYECLVTGGTDQRVGDAIWASAPLGPGSYGSTSVTVEDAAGAFHSVKFSRPTDVPIYVRAFLTVFSAPTILSPPIIPVYPADGDDLAIAAMLAYGDAQPVGRDASARMLGARAATIDGVLDVTETLVWTSAISASPAAWASSTAYTAGDQRTNDGRHYVCTTTGVSDVSGGPSTTGTAITDGSAVWRYLGAPIVIGSRQRATYDSSRIAIVTDEGQP